MKPSYCVSGNELLMVSRDIRLPRTIYLRFSSNAHMKIIMGSAKKCDITW